MFWLKYCNIVNAQSLVYSDVESTLFRQCMGGSRGGGGRGSRSPRKNHKNIEFLSNTGLDPLKNHKATKPAFNVGPSSAMAFRWRADDGQILMIFGSTH